MNKFLIFWFTCLLLLSCAEKKEEIKIDPLMNAYKVDGVKLEKDSIRKDMNFFLKKYNRSWSEQTKNKCIELLFIGQQEFKVNYRIILSIISIESQFNIKARGKNRGSTDYGLCQINSKYLTRRYKATEPLLKQYKIKYTSSKYDLGKNIFSSFMYLRDVSDYSDLIQFSDLILAYNQGVRGVKEKRPSSYYDRFLKEYLSI